MTGIGPPRFAVWLFTHLGCSPNNDALLGDLTERREHGESSFWYWKQVVFAIWSGFISQVKNHPRPILRGLAAGWIAYAIWLLLNSVLFRETLFPVWLLSPQFLLLFLGALFITAVSVHIAIGWIISRTSSEYRKPAVICYLVTTTFYGTMEFVWDRWHYWNTAPPRIELALYLSIVARMGTRSILFSIIGITATLFGSRLPTATQK